MRAIWKGVVAFGLVSIGVKLYSATEDKEIRFNSVHAGCGGRIKMPRTCAQCGDSGIPVSDLAKGWDPGDGNLVILDEADLASLPLSSSRVIEVQQFIPRDHVPPIYHEKTYYLEPEEASIKAYTLLLDALNDSGQAAIVKVALRQRERLALLSFSGQTVLTLTTMLWPDEVRAPIFKFQEEMPTPSQAEHEMALTLIESMVRPLDLDEYSDEYRNALELRIEAKMTGRAAPAPEPEPERSNVVDLMEALKASIEKNRKQREPESSTPARRRPKATNIQRTKLAKTSS